MFGCWVPDWPGVGVGPLVCLQARAAVPVEAVQDQVWEAVLGGTVPCGLPRGCRTACRAVRREHVVLGWLVRWFCLGEEGSGVRHGEAGDWLCALHSARCGAVRQYDRQAVCCWWEMGCCPKVRRGGGRRCIEASAGRCGSQWGSAPVRQVPDGIAGSTGSSMPPKLASPHRPGRRYFALAGGPPVRVAPLPRESPTTVVVVKRRPEKSSHAVTQHFVPPEALRPPYRSYSQLFRHVRCVSQGSPLPQYSYSYRPSRARPESVACPCTTSYVHCTLCSHQKQKPWQHAPGLKND